MSVTSPERYAVVAGSSVCGLYEKLNTRLTPDTVDSMPSGETRSSPARTLLPSVSFNPSVIHPRLLNVFGASLPIRVTLVRPINGACVPDPGSTVVGDNGAGLSSV